MLGDTCNLSRPLILAACVYSMFLTAVGEAHPCLCNGDANLDGEFNEADFDHTIACIGQPPFNECVNADINCDGSIDDEDIDAGDPFGGDSAILCLWLGTPAEECCPGHVPCGSPNAGSCFEDNGNPACDNLDCCITVCLSDPFCCDFWWDQFCAAAAEEDCEFVGNCPDSGGISGDLNDYVIFEACASGPLEDSLPMGCDCADFDGDNDCDLLDFAQFQDLFDSAG